jgi:hypothetical protein
MFGGCTTTPRLRTRPRPEPAGTGRTRLSRCPVDRTAADLQDVRITSCVTVAQSLLCHAQQGLSKPPERRRLPFQTIDLSLDGRRQDRVGSLLTEPSELMLEMLFGLGRDISDFLLGLESGDELPGCGHRQIIEEMFGSSITKLPSPWHPHLLPERRARRFETGFAVRSSLIHAGA